MVAAGFQELCVMTVGKFKWSGEHWAMFILLCKYLNDDIVKMNLWICEVPAHSLWLPKLFLWVLKQDDRGKSSIPDILFHLFFLGKVDSLG